MNLELSKTIPVNGIPSNGLYNAPTNITGYNTTNGVTTTPYNETLIGDSSNNLVGTSTNPYLPAILPVYIPTLYENVYSIQTNLVNDLITVSYPDDRRYPNAKAVKDYVASQLSGLEILDGEGESGTKVSTVLTTSILKDIIDINKYSTTELNGITIKNYSYEINSIDTSRNGASKIVICNAPLSDTTTMVLYAGVNGKFAALGKQYSYYQFPIQGDIIEIVQFIDNSDLANIKQNFFVKSFGGRFYN
jgi:hypothetical protein